MNGGGVCGLKQGKYRHRTGVHGKHVFLCQHGGGKQYALGAEVGCLSKKSGNIGFCHRRAIEYGAGAGGGIADLLHQRAVGAHDEAISYVVTVDQVDQWIGGGGFADAEGGNDLAAEFCQRILCRAKVPSVRGECVQNAFDRT